MLGGFLFFGGKALRQGQVKGSLLRAGRYGVPRKAGESRRVKGESRRSEIRGRRSEIRGRNVGDDRIKGQRKSGKVRGRRNGRLGVSVSWLFDRAGSECSSGNR